MQFHSSYKCAKTSELNFFHGHTYLPLSVSFGKHVIQTNPSKFDERLFSNIYLCILCVKEGREIQDFMFWGKEFQRDAPAKDIHASFRAMWKLSCFHVIIYFCHWKRYQHRSVSMSTCITCVLLCQIDWAREIRESWDFSEDGAWNALELFVDGGN